METPKDQGTTQLSPEARKDIGKRLAAARRAAGLTMMNLAIALNRSQTWVSIVESGGLKKLDSGLVEKITESIKQARKEKEEKRTRLQREIYKQHGLSEADVQAVSNPPEEAPKTDDDQPSLPTPLCARCSEVAGKCRCKEGPEVI